LKKPNMKILIAEDDTLATKTLCNSLTEWGYEFILTTNGLEAWNTLNQEFLNLTEPDSSPTRIAILDWEMPKMSGLELCKKIRNELKQRWKRYVYIVLLTGRDHQNDIIAGLEAGADDYMTKPYDSVELKVRLTNGLRIIELEDRKIASAVTDHMTNLWNRSKIRKFLNEEVDRSNRSGYSLGVLWADIDRFKQINDTYGHIVGDQVITELAGRLKKAMRKYDKIGRFGGDEFLAVFPTCRHDNIEVIGNRLCLAVNSTEVTTDAGPLKVTISVGGTSSEFYPHASSDELIETSDDALYLAKKAGRNQVKVIEPSIKKKKQK